VAFTGNYTCNSFKSGLINGDFDFDTDTIKMALYTNAATLDEDTAAYIDDPTTGEVSAPGYTDGGVTLTVEKGITNNIAFISFENVTITAALVARGALIYKDGGSNPAICVLDFGSDKVSTNTFIVTFPTASSADALIRLT
jgi:hypothetical protein